MQIASNAQPIIAPRLGDCIRNASSAEKDAARASLAKDGIAIFPAPPHVVEEIKSLLELLNSNNVSHRQAEILSSSETTYNDVAEALSKFIKKSLGSVPFVPQGFLTNQNRPQGSFHKDSDDYSILCTFQGLTTLWVPTKDVEAHETYVINNPTSSHNSPHIKSAPLYAVVVMNGDYIENQPAAYHASPATIGPDIRHLFAAFFQE